MTTWPICLECQKPYIPIPALQGCPWCSATYQTPNTIQRAGNSRYDACPGCGYAKERRSLRCWNCNLIYRQRIGQ